MKRGVESRVAAASVLQRVLDDGAHSNVAINDARSDLSGDDAQQVQRVVLGAIRHLTAIDEMLASATRRSVGDIDPEVRAVLRAGVTELLVDQGEPHGVIDSAVEATRQVGKPRATGFVNATLRRIDRERPELTDETMPVWISERLGDQYADASAALAALDQPAQRGVRIRGEVGPVPMRPAPGIRGAAYLEAGVTPAVGSVDYIDPASTAVANVARVQPGMSVLDVAAAPGGKTAALWDAMAGDGLLVAADRHPGRLRTARRRLTRMGAEPHWVVADGTRPPFRHGTFDVVLLDAPCTGLGTLRRRPEIRHRLDPDDPSRLGELQRQLIEASLPLLKPGGRLVYAVCTLFAEETIDVVGDLPATAPADTPGESYGNGLLLAPHTTGTDGMFISVIEA